MFISEAVSALIDQGRAILGLFQFWFSKNWKYLVYVLRHKYYVFVVGSRLRVSLWRLLVHDLSKFSWLEWTAYVEYFNGKRVVCCRQCSVPMRFTEDDITICRNLHCPGFGTASETEMLPPPGVRDRFDKAWNHHQKANDHHWQYWLLMKYQPTATWATETRPGGVIAIKQGNREVLETVIYRGQQPEIDATNVTRALNSFPTPLPMSEQAIREMVADWCGAGLALGNPNILDWYTQHKDDLVLHRKTRIIAEVFLDEAMTKLPRC